MRKFSVAFITTKTEIYEIEAKSGSEAAFLIGQQLASTSPPAPTHVNEARKLLGSVKPTITE